MQPNHETLAVLKFGRRGLDRFGASRLWLAHRACVFFGLLTLVACKQSKVAPESRAQTATSEDKLVVFAAASLRAPFTALAENFKQSHAGVTLTFSFAGTQELRTQLEQGADADVFASADQRHMSELEKSGYVSGPVLFARNEPVLVVAKESAAIVHGLSDLPAVKRVIVGEPEVPIGRYTLQILDRASTLYGADFRARVEVKIVSRELNVRQVFSKVSLGEADAGFVYRTDAQGAENQVKVLTIPPAINVIAEYPIAVVAKAKHPMLARGWVTLLLGKDGQEALNHAGFLAPSGSGDRP